MESKDAKAITTTEPTPRDIVCIYSQEDEPFYFQLKKSLNLWERQGHVRWLEVLPGDELTTTWQNDVKRADLILLLLSPNFFSDDLCYHIMHSALQERTTRQVPVVPMLVRAVDWRLSACKDLPIVPRNEQPVASWTSPDEAFASIGADLARLLPAWRLLLPTRPMLFRVPDLPEGYVLRPEAFQEIKSTLLEQHSGQTMAITTALRGAGGFGKTTLAIALCHDPDIQAAFPDILWVELGEQPPRALDLLNRLLAFLEGSYTEAIILQEARERWQVALRDRVCLLVIDDVWQEEALSPLLKGGPQCMRLVTTRNDLLLPKDAARVLVDAMNQREAVTLLCQNKDLPDEISQTRYQPKLEALAARLGRWPLLLTLARGMLTDLVVEYHLSIAEALTTIAEMYQTRGVTAFRLDNTDERQRTVDACLRVSMQHLEKFTHPHYHATERYQELAVFPEDTDIPLATLQIYWKRSVGLEPWETKDLCIRLHRLSLLLTCDLDTGTIRLHDVVRSYLIQSAGSHLPTLHVRLLDGYQQALGLTRWADLPQGEAYLWHHLILHLCQADRREALQATLTDLSYLTRKALYVGVSALEADLLLVSTFHSTETAEPAASLFTSLHRSIVRISHLLRQAQTEAEMGGLLLSYLSFEPAFTAQRPSWELELPRPSLTAWHSLLRESSSALLRTLKGHTSEVWGCAVSPDGRFIVSASKDHTLKVWNAATGAEFRTLKGHVNYIRDWAVSPDSRFIVSASDDHTLSVWESATGARLHTLYGHTEGVTSCAVSPDSRFIASASLDHTLKVWDAATGAELHTLTGHIDGVWDCAVSPDGSFIVSASSDGTLKVWDAATGAELRTLKGHTGWVIGCAVSPDGRFIVSASHDHTLSVWESATGARLHTLKGHTGWVNACAVSPDGCFIVSASRDCTLKVWDAATGAELRTLTGHIGGVWDWAVSPDSRFIVSASDDHTLSVWESATGARLHTLYGHTEGVTSCAVSPDSRFIVSASKDRTLKVWDAATGAELRATKGHTDRVTACAVSPDGRFIISASDDGTLKVWNAASGAEFRTLKGHTKAVAGCAVSPDGRFIVSASEDRTLKVWDAATGAELRTLKGHTKAVTDCAVSPDGRFIVSASEDHTLIVWESATGARLHTLKGHTKAVTDCAVSPDGRFIISACEVGTLSVWESATGARLHFLFGHTGSVAGCAMSPDGRFIVSASSDETLKVWNATSGKERFTLSSHTDGVNGCAVSPDGRFIVSASSDETLKVWSIQSGQCVVTFPVDGRLDGCAFHPDGEHLIAYGELGMYFLRLVV